MLRLILGKAGTGKTAAVIQEIAAAVAARQGGRLLLVPEQYSHEAERELCAVCGDSLSLYAEVFSFTGLARRIMTERGGGADRYLDKGGRLLCMALALGGIGGRLKVYAAAQRRAELQAALLAVLDELKAACVTPEQLEAAAEAAGDSFGDKLRDLALIAAAYDAAVSNGRADPADRLSVLARQIEEGGLGPEHHVYVDGFVDFTRQELEVLLALLRRGADLTVCLTVDEMEGNNEIYALSRRSARQLMAAAEALGTEMRTEVLNANRDKAEALSFFADNLFSYSADKYEGENGRISLFSAESILAECELAAARALELVRDTGCRWRDIAIAVRGFEDYRGPLESAFRQYGVPLFTARKSDLLSKPLPALIAGVYEILQGGWDPDDVISYLRTGLTGLTLDEADELADYLYKWQLRAAAWERKGDWRQHPEGYGGVYDEAASLRLERINALRHRVAAPLLGFRDRSQTAATAEEQAAALAELLEELRLPETLEKRAEELESAGREETAQEYRQLWELTVAALEQSAAILGGTEMDMAGFGRLFTRMLSMYDTGAIPVSLDRVSAGDFDRMRRRSIKHLLVLGCSDDRLPQTGGETGVFTEEERQRLLELDIGIGAGESELWREFTLLYNCLTLPSESLMMSYPLADASGEALRPAFVFGRARAIFDLPVRAADLNEVRLSAHGPALLLAAQALRSGGAVAQAAEDYFRTALPERLERLEAAAEMSRGRLSRASVEELYGKKLRLSASRIDKFASCRFAYFCQYGLKAKPYKPAGFAPPEIGSFMHYVLEKTARDVKELGGFRAVDDGKLLEITDQYVAQYVHEELNDFQEKSARFVHLFQRLGGDVRRIAADMASELRRSDFVPLDFELDFSKAQELRPLELEDGETLALTGIADRVDGWLHGDKLYLRVVDYKTGKKEFSLSEVWYGMGLQMLLYLLVLDEDGQALYGREVAPAGVMYMPARNLLLSLTRDPGDEEAQAQRLSKLRRSGFVLDDAELIEAWEHGDDKRYIPLRFKNGQADVRDLVSAQRLGKLSKHIRYSLAEMAQELRRGSIAADPYYRKQQETACMFCDYAAACQFTDGENGENYRFLPELKNEQVWDLLEGGTKDA